VTPAPADLSADFSAKNIYPATLPVTEAAESFLIILTSLMADKRRLLDLSSSLKFTLEDSSLILHPFSTSTKEELVHTKLGFTMDRNALNLGAYL
jgi:hypothetical protein